ncbi:MAG: HAMP domain-containing sensor histidine kinase [Candidatus Omnitrophica bacterium]|nr:HAMP domain-containing sensor histidine kinase [Candidatus Omnitrophota bacterium]
MVRKPVSVLLVKPNTALAKSISAAFPAGDFRLRAARSIEQAVKILSKKPQDVVVLEIGGNPLFYANLIRLFYKHSPFVTILAAAPPPVLKKVRESLSFGLCEVLSTASPRDEWPLAARRLIEKRTLVVKYLALIEKQYLLVDRLVESNRRLKQLERLKSDFLAHVSHELLTPLASMRVLLHNMEKGIAGGISDKHKEYVHFLQEGNRRLEKSLRALLNLAKLERPETKLDLSKVDLETVIQSVLSTLQPLANDKNIELRVLKPRAKVFARASEEGLEDILSNLVENAVKYTPGGGRVDVNFRSNKSHIIIEVRDTGIGIEPKRLGSIFDRFERVYEKNAVIIPGVGLGLSIAKRLVELMGGTIGVQSKPSRGSRFFFTLPKAGKEAGK